MPVLTKSNGRSRETRSGAIDPLQTVVNKDWRAAKRAHSAVSNPVEHYLLVRPVRASARAAIRSP